MCLVSCIFFMYMSQDNILVIMQVIKKLLKTSLIMLHETLYIFELPLQSECPESIVYLLALLMTLL